MVTYSYVHIFSSSYARINLLIAKLCLVIFLEMCYLVYFYFVVQRVWFNLILWIYAIDYKHSRLHTFWLTSLPLVNVLDKAKWASQRNVYTEFD